MSKNNNNNNVSNNNNNMSNNGYNRSNINNYNKICSEKNKRRVTKEVPKKIKNDIIKGDKSEEDEEDKMTRIK
jgi:hypothetical protein